MIIILQFLSLVLYSYWIMRRVGVGEAGGQGGPACAPQRDGHRARGRLPCTARPAAAPGPHWTSISSSGCSRTPRHDTNKPTSFCRWTAAGRADCGRCGNGSQASMSALGWALGEARARKIPVHAVFAWQSHPPWVDPGLGQHVPVGLSARRRRPSDTRSRPYSCFGANAPGKSPTGATPPNLTRTAQRIRSHSRGRRWKATPRTCCSGSVSGNDTLVVGSHGHGGFIGAVLGSVSQHVVSHSQCPVVVVPARSGREQLNNLPWTPRRRRRSLPAALRKAGVTHARRWWRTPVTILNG